MNVLAADIGGTNARFAILDEKLTIIWQTTIPSTGEFLPELKKILVDKDVKKACFGAAGPIENNVCKISHSSWVIDPKEITKETALEQVILINDFEAIGYAMNTKLEMHSLQGKLSDHNKIAIIGAGTGLGHSLCIKHDHFMPLPSQGCSASLFLDEEKDFPLFQSLEKPKVVESIVSGPGLSAIHKFLTKKELSPEEIMQNYEENKETWSIFERYYGSAARNYCCYTLPDALIIAGGIALKNQKRFGTTFLKRFHDNPELQDYLQTIPVLLITDPDVGLKGAGWLASHS